MNIEEFIGTNWKHVSKFENLPEEFIEKYFDKLNMKMVLRCSKVSCEFLERNFEKFTSSDLNSICEFQVLTLEFIEKHLNKLNIKKICIYQDAVQSSESFIEKLCESHKDKVDWYAIAWHRKVSKEFIKKHIKCFDVYNEYTLNYLKLNNMI